MTLYDRRLIRSLLRTILQVVSSLVGLFILIDLLSVRLERIDRYEAPLLQALLYYAYMVPEILFEYHILAIGVLVAGLMVLGRAAQNNETTALLAAGVSLRRTALPPLVLGVVLSALALGFNETIGVRLTAMQQEVAQQYLERAEGERYDTVSWSHLPDGWTCHVLSFNQRALSGQDVFLHRNTPERLDEIRARRIYWDAPTGKWIIEDGRWFSTDITSEWRQSVTRITSQPVPFDATPERLFALEQNLSARPINEVYAALQQAGVSGPPAARGWLALQTKLAQPILCGIMMLLAIPFALRYRRGGALAGFGVAIGIALAYMLVFYGGTGMAYIHLVPPIVGAWTANALFGIGGAILFIRTPT